MIDHLVCMLGLPGSGKGTQGQLLAEKLDYVYFSTGDIVRDLSAKGKGEDADNFYKEVRERFLEGHPQPDEVINKGIQEKIAELGSIKGFVLDAYPLSDGQAAFLDKMKEENLLKDYQIIFLEVPEEEIVRRLSERRVSKESHSVSVVGADRDKVEIREDDKPDVIAVRIERYKERYSPIYKYYQGREELVRVNGHQDIDVVHSDLINSLKQ